jgi:hypothetical protein
MRAMKPNGIGLTVREVMRDFRDARNSALNDWLPVLLRLARFRELRDVPIVDRLAPEAGLEPARLREALSYLREERFACYLQCESQRLYGLEPAYILPTGLEELRRRGLLTAEEA